MLHHPPRFSRAAGYIECKFRATEPLLLGSAACEQAKRGWAWSVYFGWKQN